MFNLSESVAALRDAETIISSHLLTEDERGVLLGQLLASIPPSFNRPYVATVTNALERTYDLYRPAPARPTPGEQDAAPVATGPGEGPAQAAKGSPERLPEQAQDAGSVDSSGNDGGTPAEAPAPSEKPKQGKARK